MVALRLLRAVAVAGRQRTRERVQPGAGVNESSELGERPVDGRQRAGQADPKHGEGVPCLGLPPRALVVRFHCA